MRNDLYPRPPGGAVRRTAYVYMDSAEHDSSPCSTYFMSVCGAVCASEAGVSNIRPMGHNRPATVFKLAHLMIFENRKKNTQTNMFRIFFFFYIKLYFIKYPDLDQLRVNRT